MTNALPGTPETSAKPKKPWFKKWWIWAIAAFVLIALFAPKSDDPTDGQAQTVAEEPAVETPAEPVAEKPSKPKAPEKQEVKKDPKKEKEPQNKEAKKVEPKTSAIEVLDISTDGKKLVTASFPVSDAFTSKGIVNNLKEGCVEAIQAAKDQTVNWWEYDTIQCMGLADWADSIVAVGSANFSGAQLAEISDQAMTSDPDAFWLVADDSRISPELS